MPSWIYFVQGPDNGLIKIGYTRFEPDLRYFGLVSNCPVPLAKLGVLVGGRSKERNLHDRFAHLRQHNEWFLPGTDLLKFIEKRAQPWPDSGLSRPRGPEHWIAQRDKRREVKFYMSGSLDGIELCDRVKRLVEASKAEADG